MLHHTFFQTKKLATQLMFQISGIKLVLVSDQVLVEVLDNFGHYEVGVLFQ